MDASPSSHLPTGSTSRYAGVARYLASLEMAGSDIEAPPACPDARAEPDVDVRPQLEQQAAAAAKPEMRDDDVVHGSDTSPALRHRGQVKSFTCFIDLT